MGLQPLACLECGFEFRRGRGCLSLVNVVCRQVEFSATGLITRPEESYRVCMSECDREASIMRGALAHWGLLRHGKKYVFHSYSLEDIQISFSDIAVSISGPREMRE